MKFLIALFLLVSMAVTSPAPNDALFSLQQKGSEHPEGYDVDAEVGDPKFIGSRSVIITNIEEQKLSQQPPSKRQDESILIDDITYDASLELNNCFTNLNKYVKKKTNSTSPNEMCTIQYLITAVASLECDSNRRNDHVNTKILSIQQIIDCADIPYHSSDCKENLHLEEKIWNYLKGGSMNEKSYPYKNMIKGICKFNEIKIRAKVHEYNNVNYIISSTANKSMVEMMELYLRHYSTLVSTIHIKKAEISTKILKSGIFSSNHCGIENNNVFYPINIIGWGSQTDNSEIKKDYWIVRMYTFDSSQWAIFRAFKIEKGTNMCGIEERVTYVEAEKFLIDKKMLMYFLLAA